MKNWVMVSLIVASFFLVIGASGCASTPTCNPPYILVGTSCCLDQNDNSICDKDEISAGNNQTYAINNSLVEVEPINFRLPAELPEAEVGTSYSYSVCQPDSARSGATCGNLAGATTDPTGGDQPYSFSVEFGAGFLPTGIALELNGLLRGTPTRSGDYTFGICVKDINDQQVCKTTSITVTEPSGMQVKGQITDKDTGKLVEGAIIKVAYQDENGLDKSIVANSGASSIDSDGNNYLMYLPYYLPENVVIGVNSKGYIPASKNAVVDASLEQENKYRWINFALIPISDKVIVIDNQLHHLGDNYYTGSLNSQFQMSAEGLQYSKSFTVDESQLEYSTALLKITNKGAGLSNQITLNGQSIGSLCCSPYDGSYETLQWTVDMNILKQGSNQITINSAINPDDSSDHDDFEFTDIMIEFQS